MPRSTRPEEPRGLPRCGALASWALPGIVLLGYAVVAILAIADRAAGARVLLAATLILLGSGFSLLSVEPRTRRLGWVERLALAGFLSLAIGGMLGYLLARYGWGLSFWPLLATLGAFNLTCLLVAGFRSHRAEPEISEPQRGTSSWGSTALAWWRTQSSPSRWLTGLMTLAIAAGTIHAGRTIVAPHNPIEMTEFYLVGSSGMIHDLPREAGAEQPAALKLGLVNHSTDRRSFEVRAVLGTYEIWGPKKLSLLPGASRLLDLTLEPPFGIEMTGVHKAEFTLYENGSPIRHLHVWLEVVDSTAPFDDATAVAEDVRRE